MKNKKNESGFGIIEVMVASGILAVITYAIVELTNTSLRGQKSVEKTTEIVTTNEEIRAVLSNAQACLNTFGGKNPSGNPAIVTIYDQATPPNAVYAAGKSYNRNDITLLSMSLGPSSSGGSSIATLTNNYTKNNNGNTSTGPLNLVRTIELSVNLDATGAIIGCVALSKMSDGIWSRIPGTNYNITFGGGNVIIGNPPLSSSWQSYPWANKNLFLFNDQGQGAVSIGGVSDANATYSGLYLQGDMHIGSTGWVLAHHNSTAFMEKDSFGISDFQTTAGGGAIGMGVPFTIMPQSHPCSNCIGIQTKTPAYTLDLTGNNGTNAFHIGGTGNIQFDAQNQFTVSGTSIFDGSSKLTVNSSAVSFTTPVNFTAAVTGTQFTGTLFTTSDRNLKTDIEPLEVEDKALSALEPFRFVMKNDKNKKPMLGFLAQEVKKYFPEAVEEGKDRYLTLNYPMLLAPIVAFLKNLEAKILKTNSQLDQLQSAVDMLIKQNEALTAKNKDLLKRVEQLEKAK